MQVRSKAITTLFFLGVLLVLLVPIKSAFNYYDEGFAVYNATRVINGNVPYRDFWMLYPPGQAYTLAAVFRIFSATLLAARIYDTLVRFVIVISVYLVARKITTRALVLLACVVTTLLLASVPSYVYAVFPALAFGLLSILSLRAYVDTRQPRWLLLTGAFTGIATLFRWDVGLYDGISAVFAIALFHTFGAAREAKSPTQAVGTASKPLVILSGTALPIVLIGYGYVGFSGGFANLWTQVFVFPITVFRDYRRLAYPPIIPSLYLSMPTFAAGYVGLVYWLQFYLPLLMFGIVFVRYALLLLGKRHTFDSLHVSISVLSIFGVCLFAQALSRYDYIHVLPSLMLAFLVAIPFISDFTRGIQNLVIKYALFLVFISLAAFYFALPIGTLLYLMNSTAPWGCYSHLERASCVYIYGDQEQAVDYIMAHASDDEPIYVGAQRHDMIFVNDVGFYFLAKRASATKYSELHPGVATTRPVQETIVHDIEAKHVTWIVLVNVPISQEPNLSAVSSGVHVIDDFIRSNYAPVAEFGNYEIWTRVK